MVDFNSANLYLAFDTFLLLLIGIGPKIAVVPYVEITAGLDSKTKASVTRHMLVTATLVALILLILGEFLTKLLHFSTGALSVAGGIVLLIIGVNMILSTEDRDKHNPATQQQDPMRLAAFPLAVPYLLNPAGIVALVTLSGETASLGVFAVVIGILALVVVIDILVFRWANRVSDRMDESRMLVTEKVFGFLLAALAVQLILNGLSDVGAIHVTGH